MSPSPVEYLQHIPLELRFLREALRGVRVSDFLGNELLKRGCVRSLEVIGEAAGQIAPDIRNQFPEIDWKNLVGLRNRLIHGYFGIDYDIVWDVIKHKVPRLDRQIRMMLAQVRRPIQAQ